MPSRLDAVEYGQTPRDDHDDLVAWTHEWGLLLRSARQVAGLSLAGLGERTGLSRGYLSKLESGQDGARNPSRATLAALARALPSFKPLAYQLEPAGMASAMSVTLAEELSALAPIVSPPSGLEASDAPMASEDPQPIQLGWREFEALVAFLALERSAAPIPLSARVIARAADRPVADMRRTLAGLVEQGALWMRPPARQGDDPVYRRSEGFETQLGVLRLGDALILAAALLTQASTERSRQPRAGSNRRDGDW